MNHNILKKFCFIGEVDCGKSTIAGHLYYLCGGVSKHELEQVKKDLGNKKTQLWSALLDIYTEERERGKTNEFSTLLLKYKDVEYQLIDTPGHQIYIRSLIEGISQFNANEIIACLVLSARSGEFEKGWLNGQTKEDIILARGVGIRNLVVLVNKMDTVNWLETEFKNICQKVTPYIKKCKFESCQFIPVSGYDGIGLDKSVGLPIWYKEKKCLMEVLQEITIKVNPKTNLEFPESWTKMECHVQIVELKKPPIIAEGFSCILHYQSEEYNVIFEDVSNLQKENIKFLKDKDIGKIIISSEIPIEKQETKNNTINLIFRSSENTIAFGKIVKILS